MSNLNRPSPGIGAGGANNTTRLRRAAQAGSMLELQLGNGLVFDRHGRLTINTDAIKKGLMGPQGAQGPAGAVGADGSPGLNGQDGIDGAPGSPGQNGIDGAPGEPGADGAAGPQGPQGEQGPPGPPGQAGATGPQGQSGPGGPAGPAGPSGSPHIASYTLTEDAYEFVLSGYQNTEYQSYRFECTRFRHTGGSSARYFSMNFQVLDQSNLAGPPIWLNGSKDYDVHHATMGLSQGGASYTNQNNSKNAVAVPRCNGSSEHNFRMWLPGDALQNFNTNRHIVTDGFSSILGRASNIPGHAGSSNTSYIVPWRVRSDIRDNNGDGRILAIRFKAHSSTSSTGQAASKIKAGAHVTVYGERVDVPPQP